MGCIVAFKRSFELSMEFVRRIFFPPHGPYILGLWGWSSIEWSLEVVKKIAA